MQKVLDKIVQENDIKKIEKEEYGLLAEEIRHFLIENISRTGGHLASNLGVVELTMALHLCMDFPEDKLIWDVGHQAYTHKILTGRKNDFTTLRQFGGLSGFPKRRESSCDSIDTGHSSTSISVALGLAVARDLKGKQNKVVAVIGDGALSGGMAYEALNNAARLKSNLLIILNDNHMSISENVGGMANYLGKIRTNSRYQNLKSDVENALKRLPIVGNKIVDNIRRSKDSIKRLVIPGMLFEDMGITYIGPIDGHNLEQLVTAIKTVSKVREAVIIHVVTKKGKGYSLAEKNPLDFHGVDPFIPKTGKARAKKVGTSYTNVFSSKIMELAEKDDRIVAITAAMPAGTGLVPFEKYFPKRFFDVGIAEEHAVTFAAGLALEGFRPYVVIYSTFLQRAYDQILHDVCINHLPVVFAIDRAGIVGNDGETHQGIFDLSYLSSMPNMTILAPKNRLEFEEMLEFSRQANGPMAIRYPRGAVYEGLSEFHTPIKRGKSEWIYREKDVVLLAVGSMVKTGEEVYKQLKKLGHFSSLVNVRFIKPFDQEILIELLKEHHTFVTMEENVTKGGFGQMVSDYLLGMGKTVKVLHISIPDCFVEQGDVDRLKKKLKMDPETIVERIIKET